MAGVGPTQAPLLRSEMLPLPHTRAQRQWQSSGPVWKWELLFSAVLLSGTGGRDPGAWLWLGTEWLMSPQVAKRHGLQFVGGGSLSDFSQQPHCSLSRWTLSIPMVS